MGRSPSTIAIVLATGTALALASPALAFAAQARLPRSHRTARRTLPFPAAEGVDCPSDCPKCPDRADSDPPAPEDIPAMAAPRRKPRRRRITTVAGPPSRALRVTSSVARYGPSGAVHPAAAAGGAPLAPASAVDGFGSLSSATDASPKSWLDSLTSLANVASILCVVDCTVLPLVTVLFPLFGLAAGGSNMAGILETIGHSLALWFVIPVGMLATATGYLGHRSRRPVLPSALGLLLVYLCNSGSGGGCCAHDHVHDAAVGMASSWSLLSVSSVLAALRSAGWVHRVSNLAGCALLLTGNYLSRRAAAAAGTGCGVAGCDRDHTGIGTLVEEDKGPSFFTRTKGAGGGG